MKQRYVGVDGGDTKITVAIFTANSVPTQAITYLTCSRQSTGIPEPVALIMKVVREALSGGEVSLQDCTGRRVGMPYYGENPVNGREIVRSLTDVLTPVSVYVMNDGEVNWVGSLVCEEGIHIASGTGPIASGCGCDREFVRCGGWVEFFGDEGSCYWIGRQGMSLFFRETGGRLSRDPLYDLVHEEFGLTEDHQPIDRIVRGSASYRERIAGFQRCVLRAARAGDTVATVLYKTAALRLVLMIRTLKAKPRFSAEPISVSYSGDIFHAGEFILAPLRRKAEELDCILCESKYSATEGVPMLVMRRFPPSLS